MIQKTIYNLLRHRHFWRDMDFSELSEIYISVLFRSLSINLTSIFIPLYMLRLGYSAVSVLFVLFCYFAARFLIFDVVAGVMTSRIGPKHTIMASYFLLTASTLQFLTLHSIHWPLWLLGGLWGGSASLFNIAFAVDFSRINHKAHGGKELAYANIMDKGSALLGPIVSGIVGVVFGGQYIFLAAIVILFIGGIPLLRTAEPIKVGAPLNLGAIDMKKMKRDLISYSGFGIENTFCTVLWPLYLSLFVIVGSTAYAKLGLLASLSVVISVTAAYTIGHLVDSDKGRSLLRGGAILNALVHCFRPFVSAYAGALVVNGLNEGVTTSYRLPYTKGMYDNADSHGDLRVAYITVMEIIGSYTKAFAYLILIGISRFMSNRSLLTFGFLIAATASLVIMTEVFSALIPAKTSADQKLPELVEAPAVS